MESAQLQALKTWLLVNAQTLDDQQAADALNILASPHYWVWRASVTRRDIYTTVPDTGSSWNWTTYKNQPVSEQNAWVQMFMGDEVNFSHMNVRVGIAAIFTGSASANAQRDHCLAVGRRKCTIIEKLLAIAVTSPPANTGNDGIVGNRGNTTNPDVLGFEGFVTPDDIVAAYGA
jgi:hypothetical protein